MSWAEVALIVNAVGVLIAGVGSIVSAIIGSRNTRQIKEVHDLTNSKMTELGEEIRKGAHLAGKAEALKEHQAATQ